MTPDMYAKGKGSTAPSDAQAREKLALYVYEYLLHAGAQKAAQTFLNEIRWEKNITLGEPPGFLHSWWCVFWDLYCAAPERRDSCDHSSEAKAFHDYGFVNSGYSVNGMPPHPGQPLLPSGMDPNRPPGPRMTPPRGPGPMGPMGPYGPMRGPPPGPPLPPMGSRAPWPPTSVPGMSPGYPGPPGPPGPPVKFVIGDGMYSMMKPTPGGPIPDMCGPPDGMGPGGGGPMGPGGGPPNGGPDNLDNLKTSPGHGPGTPREDSGGNNSTGSGGGGGSGGSGGGGSGIGEFGMGGYGPSSGPGGSTGSGSGPSGGGGGENVHNESAAILKIKESMQEEAKRFEKDSDHPDYFMQ
ncbi:single-stranded DNA-binding protein 3-like isoform X2 [Tigriopus californicus]|uniref:single-stranded DNA-binding protein 3-like isoform X2 n=1 Tax=Tigriopus californicus TaxID=6832 RepID=UPI0027D9ECA7|nr:single-stranded DNA-binding protein 3-like isoform X2 [Tigriopus californicus]